MLGRQEIPACLPLRRCQALGVAAHARVVTSGLDADCRQSHGVPFRLPEPEHLAYLKPPLVALLHKFFEKTF